MSNDAYSQLSPMANHTFDRLGKIGYEKLSRMEKIFICVWSLGGEVDNGGFEQWLFNTSGDWALDTLESLKAINASETAKLVEDAIKAFPKGNPPKDMDKRRVIMDSVSDKTCLEWERLSQKYYEKNEDLDELLLAYLHKASKK